MATKNTNDWTKTDKRYGWKFGCDGTVNAKDAAQIVRDKTGLKFDASYMARFLRQKTHPLRAKRNPLSMGKGSPWIVCRRSVEEFAKMREPVEV